MTTTRPRTHLLATLTATILALTATGCGSGNDDLAWQAPQFPRQSDLGDLAPQPGRNQRLFNDATLDLQTHDGRQFTIEAGLFWIVLGSPSDVDDNGDRTVNYFQFRQTTGRDDADMIPALSELAASFGYQFDETAATDFVLDNDDGFRMWPKDLAEDDYGIVLEVDDELNNTVIATFYFAAEGRPISETPDDFEPNPFNGRLIEGGPLDN